MFSGVLLAFNFAHMHVMFMCVYVSFTYYVVGVGVCVGSFAVVCGDVVVIRGQLGYCYLLLKKKNK